MGASKRLLEDMREKSLYSITEKQQNLMIQIEEMDGELTPEVESLLEITKASLNQKSIAYLEVIGQKDGINTVIDLEIKRLQSLKKRNDNIVKRLKENLLKAVLTFGTYTIGLQTFSTRKSESIEVEFVNELPDKYKTRKLTETADKVGLKKAIKEGIEIEGVTLKSNFNLKIN